MSNQDFDGKTPANRASGAPAAPADTPESLEQQLAKERDARVQMRDRLRNTEALAAESHALRSRMSQELERVTADRDRLRTAANAPAVGSAASRPATSPPSSAGIEPQFTPRMTSAIPPSAAPRAGDWSTKPPAPPARSGPWRTLAMLGGLAAGVACLAWITGTLPGESGTGVAAGAAPAAAHVTAASGPAMAPARPNPTALALAPAPAPAPALPGGAVALPPLTPEQQLAAAPPAVGPSPLAAPAAATSMTPDGMSARLRTALDGEGIAAKVEVDPANGHVMVADPQADDTSRDRTDLVIRSVYAGASLPEPQIEHRWLSPKRGDRVATPTIVAPKPAQAATPATAATPTPAATPVQAARMSAAAAYAARHATTEHATEYHRKSGDTTVADAEELRPVLPEGRVTAGCRTSLAGKSTLRRADMTACMKTSCCSSSGSRQSEDCRAYEKAYPFTCSAG